MNDATGQPFDIDQVDWSKSPDGLVPAIVQDPATGAVLMLAYMNRESLERTLESGRVTFFSRSRDEIWTKGETSGNFLDFESAVVDCDGDALLVQASPTGPVCHTGAETCFGESRELPFLFLGKLQAIIEQRRQADPDSSYTASLLQGPLHRTAQKVGEEAVESILAATSREEDDLIDESADLLYHLMVLLAKQDLNLQCIVDRLAERHKK